MVQSIIICLSQQWVIFYAFHALHKTLIQILSNAYVFDNTLFLQENSHIGRNAPA